MGQVIKRGIIQGFNASTYTVSVLLFEATSTFLTGVPVANAVDGTSGLAGALCAVLFFDEQNPQDAVVIATYGTGSAGGMGVPTPPPGRVVFVASVLQVNGDTLAAGTTNTYTLTGGSSGLAVGALGVLYKAFFTSATVGAYVQMCPHGGNVGSYVSIGNMSVANGFLNDAGVLPVDAGGRIDVKANVGTCTFTLYTYGYVM